MKLKEDALTILLCCSYIFAEMQTVLSNEGPGGGNYQELQEKSPTNSCACVFQQNSRKTMWHAACISSVRQYERRIMDMCDKSQNAAELFYQDISWNETDFDWRLHRQKAYSQRPNISSLKLLSSSKIT